MPSRLLNLPVLTTISNCRFLALCYEPMRDDWKHVFGLDIISDLRRSSLRDLASYYPAIGNPLPGASASLPWASRTSTTPMATTRHASIYASKTPMMLLLNPPRNNPQAPNPPRISSHKSRNGTSPKLRRIYARSSATSPNTACQNLLSLGPNFSPPCHSYLLHQKYRGL